MIKVFLDKRDLVNLVCGVEPKSMTRCELLTQRDYMKLSGDQYNSRWDWVRRNLEKLTEEELFELYLDER